MDIEHITTSVRKPTTYGKIETFHKAYQVKSHLFKEHWNFIRYYNYTRPHKGIKYLTPANIYLKQKV
ncbi:MAG: integrase core domain-containing protein [Nitrososphaerota archaeon]|nr:integrase core domain-containing protein [Nitrososphaerota archaeon]